MDDLHDNHLQSIGQEFGKKFEGAVKQRDRPKFINPHGISILGDKSNETCINTVKGETPL